MAGEQPGNVEMTTLTESRLPFNVRISGCLTFSGTTCRLGEETSQARHFFRAEAPGPPASIPCTIPHQHPLFTRLHLSTRAALAFLLLRRCMRATMDLADSPRKPLGELIGNLGYTGHAEKRNLSGEAITKRRRIELQDPATTSILARKPLKAAIELPAPVKPKKRAKSPAKKPRTVTEAATAAYQPPRAPAEPESTASKFFAPEEVVAKPKKPRKPRTKPAEGVAPAAKKPGRPKKVKVTFEKPLPPPLYSPQHATLQAEQQSFLFGTSSQLAAEESPSFIRQMQAAIVESELVPSTQAMGISPKRMSCAKVPTAPHGTSLSVGQADLEHWRAASRDWKGGLLREKSGLKTRKKPAAPAVKPPTVVEARKPPPPDPVPMVQPAPPAAAVEKQHPASEPDSFINIDDISDHEPAPTPSPPRRKASASPKPVPPLIFDVPSSPLPVPADPRVKTILASNAVLKATDAQWPALRAQLFPQITAVVKTAQRGTDPGKPSWYQKILLYDPIVLEDLMAWLNAQGLRVAVQRSQPKKGGKGSGKKQGAQDGAEGVQPSESVKGRKNKGAGASAVAEGGLSEQNHEVVQEELQPWMVQKWCEEKSVCCLWKEGLRGGVRGNY
ncbi:5'-flap endonuclease [Teratosphaeriaceae sp. CCFEE 6253]|nr:5'-flap endonuclease [Teratosphaeriaceae sp. CCFEE 6253]